MATLSAYEQERDKKIKERNEMLSGVLQECRDISKAMLQPVKQARTLADGRRTSIKLKQRLRYDFSPPRTRSRSNGIVDLPELEDQENRQGLVVKFRFKKLYHGVSAGDSHDPDDDTVEVFDDDSDSDTDKPDEGSVQCPPPSIRQVKHRGERMYLLAEEVTPRQLSTVCDTFGAKVYSQAHGTSCHQCRQKTLDMKTVCRSADCVGVRGQFCGPCLKIRYGEDAREALKDPDWACPACRGICNCSICRNRAGYGSTGILIHTALENGFDNVRDYLESKRKKQP